MSLLLERVEMCDRVERANTVSNEPIIRDYSSSCCVLYRYLVNKQGRGTQRAKKRMCGAQTSDGNCSRKGVEGREMPCAAAMGRLKQVNRISDEPKNNGFEARNSTQ